MNKSSNGGPIAFLALLLTSNVFTASSQDAPAPVERPARHPFPDFNVNYVPPEDQYEGPLFQLSQDYPHTLPEVKQPVKDILAIPFDDNGHAENWLKYMLKVREYCFDNENIALGWKRQNEDSPRWFHVPWQHYGEKGREGINGLTREATAQPKQLAPTQKDRFQTHAVAVYNELGGYTIGRVWRNQFEPNPKAALFPVGTVVVKVLFTQADENQVPYLKNPIRWKAFVQDPANPTKRKVQDLQLLQMDIMVRDDRAKATGGWVFGTYCYNGNLSSKNRWENLVPVGLQWGNDPEVVNPDHNPENKEPIETIFNDRLKQTVINRSKDLPPQHLGWGGRLNGPADYYRSSCMSCHSTAQYPAIEEQHPDFDTSVRYRPDDPQWAMWFRNLDCGKAFSPITEFDKSRAVSTDYSLQLSIGIEQFFEWKSNTMGGYFTPVLVSDQPNDKPPTKRNKVTIPTSEPPSTFPR